MFSRNFLTIAIVLALLFGFVIGYYTNSTDTNTTKTESLETENVSVDENLQNIADEVNPYTDVEDVANPYKDTYTNPFE